MEWEQRFREIAHRHRGLLAKFHLPEIECTMEHWRRAKRNGRWDSLSPRVLRLRGAPESDGQRALAAVLDASPGAVLHGQSTLAWFRLGGYDLRVIQVARPRWLSGNAATIGHLHRLRDLREGHVTVVRGVPTERALRAIWSEAARYGGERLFEIGVRRIGRLLDDAHVRGLVTWAELHEMVDDIHQRGRSGSTIMRVLAHARRPGSSPTESRNEDRLEEALRDAGERPLCRQATVGGVKPVGRCDFRDRELPLVVEVDSLAFHSSPSDRADDERRYARLTEAGFTVAVVWEDDLWRRPRAVVETVAAARRRSRDRRPVVLHTPSCPWPRSEVA